MRKIEQLLEKMLHLTNGSCRVQTPACTPIFTHSWRDRRLSWLRWLGT